MFSPRYKIEHGRRWSPKNSCVYAGGNTQKQSTRGEEHGRNLGKAVLYIHGRYTQEANALTHPNTLRRSRQCPWYNPTFSRQGLHINQSLCSSFLPGAQNQPINIALQRPAPMPDPSESRSCFLNLGAVLVQSEMKGVC